jgi:SPP1 family phage portal protein
MLQMLTYQDLEAVADKDEKERMQFVLNVIHTHKSSEAYKIAKTADEYNRELNTTIVNYQKMLYTISGEAVYDLVSANNKLCSNFFNRFVTQEVQHLLGNGASWSEKSTADKVGKNFDEELQALAADALVCGVAFGFWNLDHMDDFSLLEFAPLWDEEDGSLKAGVRFWQIDPLKPLRATLYELDGYTDYIWRAGKEPEVLHPKRMYKITTAQSPADGVEIIDGENYPNFPIVPLWANKRRQSELVGRREQIDAYDLIKSGFANDLDDVSQIYWIIQNAGGMDEVDLATFLNQLKRVHAAVMDEDGATAESHTVDIPYNARETILARLRDDLHEDFMALDLKNITGGAATATQIKASYELLTEKCDGFEYCVLEFIRGILELIGIEDEPTFTRSMIVNTAENVSIILQAAQYLPEDYITQKLLDVMGDGDKAEAIMEQKDEEDMERFAQEQGGESEALEQYGSDVTSMLEELSAMVGGEGESEEAEEEASGESEALEEYGEDVAAMLEELSEMIGGEE